MASLDRGFEKGDRQGSVDPQGLAQVERRVMVLRWLAVRLAVVEDEGNGLQEEGSVLFGNSPPFGSPRLPAGLALDW